MGVTIWTCSMLHLCLIICSSIVTVQCRYEEPREAFGVLKERHTNPGEIDLLGDLTVYRFGPATNDKWIIWGHDIYGVDSGRTKEYCEKMNQDLGVTCILPDFFRGVDGRPDPIPVWTDELIRDWEDLLVPYLELGEAKSVGVVGTCFGSYIVMHASASGVGFIKGGVSIHPAHPGLMESANEDEASIYSKIESPQSFMDTPDSSETVREDGLASQVIDNTFFTEYEDPCNHGFFNRGDLSDKAVEACVNRAMADLLEFLMIFVVN